MGGPMPILASGNISRTASAMMWAAECRSRCRRSSGVICCSSVGMALLLREQDLFGQVPVGLSDGSCVRRDKAFRLLAGPFQYPGVLVRLTEQQIVPLRNTQPPSHIADDRHAGERKKPPLSRHQRNRHVGKYGHAEEEAERPGERHSELLQASVDA